MHNALPNCFKTQCVFTTHLWHRAHSKLVFAANAKVYAGSVAAVQQTACKAAESLPELAALSFNSFVLGPFRSEARLKNHIYFIW